MCESAAATSQQPPSNVHDSNPDDQERVDDEELKPILPGRRSKRNRVIYKSATSENSALQVDKPPTRSFSVVFKWRNNGDNNSSAGKSDKGGKEGMKYPPEIRRHNTYL